jgi:hypothetical protein
MAMEWTTNAQRVAPSAAASQAMTANASSWNNSGWFELLASASGDLLVTGLEVVAVGAPEPFEVDLGVGAAAAETVITTFRGQYRAAGTHGPGYIPHVIPLDAIPSGSRVAARFRKNGTDVDPWSVSFTYLTKPITGSLTTTTTPQKVAPVSAILTVTANASAWVDGTWGTVLASAAADLVVVGVVIPAATTGDEWEIDLGVGAALSEVVITTLRGNRTFSFTDGPSFFPLPTPLDTILSGERVAARMRMSGAGAARTTTVAIVYHEKPL